MSPQASNPSAIHFAGSDFFLDPEDVSEDLLSALLDCGGSGRADDAVALVIQEFSITGNVNDCRSYLYGYGAWEDVELADHRANLERLVWLTGGSLCEGESAYFSRH